MPIDTNNINRMVSKSVRIWLFIGVVMVFMQIMIGGITRLTDSGLSITEWAVIQGTIPPLNHKDWLEAFDKYKIAAKKQYESIHADMTLSEFKVIYFWEYFHRLWARTLGFVFLFPFLYFMGKKKIPRWLLRRLGITIGLAILVATFGWIMVASGLNDDQRTWVSAYKLVGHLCLASLLFGYLVWTWLMAGRKTNPLKENTGTGKLYRLGWLILVVLIVQIIFGGLMAGMRAGLVHPYFPMFVEGENLSAVFKQKNLDFLNYEASAYVKMVVQIMHRTTAYLLTGMILFFFVRLRKLKLSRELKRGNYLLLVMIAVQFLLGVLTIINCFGKVPVLYGSLHQGGAFILFGILLFVLNKLKSRT